MTIHSIRSIGLALACGALISCGSGSDGESGMPSESTMPSESGGSPAVDLAITNARVFTGTGADVMEGATILITAIASSPCRRARSMLQPRRPLTPPAEP